MSVDLYRLLFDLSEELRSDSATDARQLAESALRKVGQRVVFGMAVSDLTTRIESARREAQLIAERAAVRRLDDLGPLHGPVVEPEWSRANRAEVEARSVRLVTTRGERFARVATDPTYQIPFVRARLRPEGEGLQYEELEEFIDFMGDNYNSWYEKGCEIESTLYREGGVTANSSDWQMFRRTYFVDPRDSSRRGGRAYSSWQRDKATDEFISAIKAEARLELTEELLGSVFAVGDGRRVSWRHATLSDHESRIAMLKRDISGTAAAAARHELAVGMIRAAGVECLGQVA